MKKTIEELYDIESRNPWSIRQWLKAEGFDEDIIDRALHEYANRISAGHRFGFKNGISQLSIAIRNRVRELTEDQNKGLSDRFGEYILNKPFIQLLYRKLIG